MRMLYRAGFLLALIMTMASSHLVAAQDASPEATPGTGGGLAAAVTWLLTQQDTSGGFLGFNGDVDPGTTVDALLALSSAEQAGVDTGEAIPDALAYLGSGDIALVYTQTGPGQAAKLALGLASVGENPRDFAGVDPLSILDFGQNAETGVYGTGLYDHAYAMLALAAAGEEVPTSAIDGLVASQAANGGWGYDGSGDDAASDSNTTALVVQAIAASGLADQGTLEAAMTYLMTTLREGEGAAYNADATSIGDSNSTALVAQAVIATGGDPASDEWGDLISALVGYQNADGSLYFQAGVEDPNLLSTVQGIPAIAGYAFPIPAAEGATGTPVGLVPGETWLAAA